MRIAAIFTFGLLVVSPGLALADASVAGHWQAELGDDVKIEMHVSPDGKWDSETAKGGETIAQMEGTYRQKIKSSTSGNLVFVPTKSKVTAQHGAPKTEYDSYRLSDNGQVLNLTSAGDTLEFHKQTN